MPHGRKCEIRYTNPKKPSPASNKQTGAFYTKKQKEENLTQQETNVKSTRHCNAMGHTDRISHRNMSMNTNVATTLIVIALVVGLGGGWYIGTQMGNKQQTPQTQEENMINNEIVDIQKAEEEAEQEDLMLEQQLDLLVGSSAPQVSPVSGSEASTNEGVAVTYTNEGFAPKTLTIKKGTTVTWTNNSSSNMWVASAVHPSHIVYDGNSLREHCGTNAQTPFDECKGDPAGATWSFTFEKVGTWGYHDHINASRTGSITVTE